MIFLLIRGRGNGWKLGLFHSRNRFECSQNSHCARGRNKASQPTELDFAGGEVDEVDGVARFSVNRGVAGLDDEAGILHHATGPAVVANGGVGVRSVRLNLTA